MTGTKIYVYEKFILAYIHVPSKMVIKYKQWLTVPIIELVCLVGCGSLIHLNA